ncbi:hypothetical protein [Moorena sp. SIO3A5]|uniref:hypothetical protein n=1 Tax=Moorena sp. SIO3A5 TaxID=2607822 RepID=UPI00141D2FCD|nr:hypothetical protein [Moorena sp. SIO3A5]NEP69011.1 hypothetical protein [Moorena sp. SIO3A5]NES80762.1 hypothetical protein [Moorena sp. SIO2B7]
MVTQNIEKLKCDCPICDKPDWCGISADGTAVRCERAHNRLGLSNLVGDLRRIIPNRPHNEESHFYTLEPETKKKPRPPQVINWIYTNEKGKNLGQYRELKDSAITAESSVVIPNAITSLNTQAVHLSSEEVA